jgi:uncharacterized protein (DUF983 family)
MPEESDGPRASDGDSATTPMSTSSTVAQAVSRGIRLRCPMCGRSKLFQTWFRMNKRCPECGFVFERDPGYFLGSTYINYGLTTLISTWSYIFWRFGMGADHALLVPALAAFCVIFPVVFFRYARSLWLSFDCFVDRSGALEFRRSDDDPESRKA